MSDSSFNDSNDFLPYTSLETTSEKNRRLLHTYLSRFNKSELLNFVWEDNFDFCRLIPRTSLENPKYFILQVMIDITINSTLKHTSIDDVIGALDLSYIVLHSEKRTWQGFQITVLGNFFNNDEKLEKSFKEELLRRNVNIQNSTSRMHKESIWLRLSIWPLRLQPGSKSKVLYLQYYPGLRVLFLNGINPLGKKQLTPVLEALCSTFQSPNVQPLELKGPNIFDLLIMAVQKNAQLIAHPEQLPLSLQTSLRRNTWSSTETILESTELNHMRLRRRVILKEAFGEFQAPKLKKYCLRMTTHFFGSETSRESRTMCEVEYKGSSVLQGLCNMFDQGKFPGKIPLYLKKSVTSGADILYLSD